MAKGLRLQTLTIKLPDGRQIELSIEDARELHDQLAELFGPKIVSRAPIIIERQRAWPRPWESHWVNAPDIGTPLPYRKGEPWVTCELKHSSGLSLCMSGPEA